MLSVPAYPTSQANKLLAGLPCTLSDCVSKEPSIHYPNFSGARSEPEEAKALEELNAMALKLRFRVPLDEPSRLRRSYALIYEIIKYLARNGLEPEQYLLLFMNSAEDQMYPARRTVSAMVDGIVMNLSSVKLSSPLRTAHPMIFHLLGALEPLCAAFPDPYDDIQDWMRYWSRAQPIILELATLLDQAGFGGDDA
ncbi:hypothetical protein B0H10DRAFT_1949845 [Mycena sp. CBHHK59/15]|nr:hypothetical protein B0H10DRAFT_1949845 [Mycena sp. CBHHK59/15]